MTSLSLATSNVCASILALVGVSTNLTPLLLACVSVTATFLSSSQVWLKLIV